MGADPVSLVEPDRRLVRFLARSLDPGDARVSYCVRPFERANLPAGAFDLGVAATSFHWMPERLALRKVARALRPGGWWASWNTHHADPYRPNPFHRAVGSLYRELTPAREVPGYTRSRARKDQRDQIRALESVGKFDRISREDIRWTATLGTDRVTALWGSFSEIATLPARPRERFLQGLTRLVDDRFGGEVTFPVLTPLYTARRV
jgi:SAM-dependent methyltransferase